MLIIRGTYHPQDLYLDKVNQGEETFTEQGLAAMLREIFVIGSESESVMLRWALRLLSCHTDVQETLQAELDKVKVSPVYNIPYIYSIKLSVLWIQIH